MIPQEVDPRQQIRHSGVPFLYLVMGPRPLLESKADIPRSRWRTACGSKPGGMFLSDINDPVSVGFPYPEFFPMIEGDFLAGRRERLGEHIQIQGSRGKNHEPMIQDYQIAECYPVEVPNESLDQARGGRPAVS